MDRLSRSVEDVLSRHPAPALSLEELGALLARESGTAPLRPAALLRAIKDEGSALRLVEGDPERIGVIGPRRWVLAPPDRRRGQETRPLLAARLRESVRALGEAVQPGSTLALARWARLLSEERKVRSVLARPGVATGPGPDRIPAGRPRPS